LERGRLGVSVRIVGTAQKRIRALVAESPTISVRRLARRAGVSESTASKWLAILAVERGQQAQ
jgi:hypothetical protein